MKRIALVTGASSGIGWDIARYLNENDITVIAAARRLEQMRPLKEQGIFTVRLDVADTTSIDAMLEEVRREVGEVDILVSNAAIMYMAPAEYADIKEVRRLFDTNFFGLMELTQKCLDHMRAQGWGRVVNISSIGGVTSMPFNGIYQASKFALEGWSRALKQEVRQFGIGVSLIRPGAVKSEIFDNTLGQERPDLEWTGIYKDDFANMLDFIDSTQVNGADPACISELVYQVISVDSPKVAYIGPAEREEAFNKAFRETTEDERDAGSAKRLGM